MTITSCERNQYILASIDCGVGLGKLVDLLHLSIFGEYLYVTQYIHFLSFHECHISTSIIIYNRFITSRRNISLYFTGVYFYLETGLIDSPFFLTPGVPHSPAQLAAISSMHCRPHCHRRRAPFWPAALTGSTPSVSDWAHLKSLCISFPL